MIKNVLFDFGGVMHDISSLAQEREDIRKALSVTPGDTQAEKICQEAVLKFGSGQLTEQQYWQELSDKLGVPIPPNYHELHRVALRDHSAPFPQMLELVKRLKQAGIKVYVLSNSIAPHSEVIRAKGWYDPFDQVLLSQELGLRKPDKEIFVKALHELNIKAEETLFIDDLAENLPPAQELGMATIHAVSPDQVVKDVEQLVF